MCRLLLCYATAYCGSPSCVPIGCSCALSHPPISTLYRKYVEPLLNCITVKLVSWTARDQSHFVSGLPQVYIMQVYSCYILAVMQDSVREVSKAIYNRSSRHSVAVIPVCVCQSGVNSLRSNLILGPEATLSLFYPFIRHKT